MDIYIIILVVGAGIIVGFVNTLAGSGSLLTLPLLMFLGLPANVANGTNRIGILLQSLVATASFRQKKVLELEKGTIMALPAVAGAVIGAMLAVNMTELVMERIIGVLLFIMFFVILYKPERWIKGHEGEANVKPGLLRYVIFFFIGLYGGFIQVGIGLFLLAGLVLGAGYDLVKANALKVLIVLLFTPLALVVFIVNSQVDYLLGIMLAAGNMAGAYLATRFAVKWGPVFVRYVLLVVVFLSSLELLGVFDLLFR